MPQPFDIDRSVPGVPFIAKQPFVCQTPVIIENIDIQADNA
jgi:hypothetical protein